MVCCAVHLAQDHIIGYPFPFGRSPAKMAMLRVLMTRSDPRLLLRKAVWDVLQREDADVDVDELLAAARAAASSAEGQREGAEAADEDEAEEEEAGDFDEEPLPEELDSIEEQSGECSAATA